MDAFALRNLGLMCSNPCTSRREEDKKSEENDLVMITLTFK